MSQSSFLSIDPHPNAGKRVQVLVPYPVDRAYDYLLPEGMVAGIGDYVSVPLGRRETVGVIWSMDAGDDDLDIKKIKFVLEKFDAPPMTDGMRQFIAWMAKYTMTDMGAVLKMAVNMPDALTPPQGTSVYHLPETIEGRLSAPRKKVIAYLENKQPTSKKDIMNETDVSPSVIKGMVDAGQLIEQEGRVSFPCENVDLNLPPLSFSLEQQSAVDVLVDRVGQGKFSSILLDGVTGSGKTEVYFEGVAKALADGRQVLILLPEIALSTQFLSRFKKRFGVAPAVWHSDIGVSQKRNTWRGVAEGKTRVVIGARSALFLPYADLGLIVVDEEHEQSYKQEEGVLYHARDMAIVRARMGDFPITLVSATPSLETMVNVQQNKYDYVHLPERHAGATLPDVTVVDLKTTPPERQRFLSPPLLKGLMDVLAAKEQALLFLNRRGYAPLTLCRTCGYRFQCPSCTAWLVEHKRSHKLQCHHCGYTCHIPDHCPDCEDDSGFASCGPGVERIEEEVKHLFPDAKTLILASDIMSNVKVLSDAIQRIEKGDVDIIIGTQMIAKGHHFPDLTLVGIVDADLGLNGGDLRAGERSFQLLHQVSGRAGRGEKPGHVFIQTYMPEQKVIQALAANDRDAFLAAEMTERERAGMPPFGKLAGVILSSAKERELDDFCMYLARKAPRYDDIRILGPAPAPLAYLRKKHRRRFLVKADRVVNIQKYMDEWMAQVKVPSAIKLKIDIDPQSFF